MHAWILLFGVYSQVFVAIVIHIIGSVFTVNFIKLLLNRLNSGKNLDESIKLYRQRQFLNVLCNSVQQGSLGVAIIGIKLLAAIGLSLVHFIDKQ